MQNESCTVIDTPEGIELYRLMAIRSGLELELMGMRHSRDAVFNAAKQITGKKTRKACLLMIGEKIKQLQNKQ